MLNLLATEFDEADQAFAVFDDFLRSWSLRQRLLPETPDRCQAAKLGLPGTSEGWLY